MQVDKETIKARQVLATANGISMDGVSFQASGRRTILFCGRRVFIESFDEDDGHYAKIIGDALTEMIDEKFAVKPQSYYRDLVKKRYG